MNAWGEPWMQSEMNSFSTMLQVSTLFMEIVVVYIVTIVFGAYPFVQIFHLVDEKCKFTINKKFRSALLHPSYENFAIRAEPEIFRTLKWFCPLMHSQASIQNDYKSLCFFHINSICARSAWSRWKVLRMWKSVKYPHLDLFKTFLIWIYLAFKLISRPSEKSYIELTPQIRFHLLARIGGVFPGIF